MLVQFLIPDWLRDIMRLTQDMLKCAGGVFGILHTVEQIHEYAESLLEAMNGRINLYPETGCTEKEIGGIGAAGTSNQTTSVPSKVSVVYEASGSSFSSTKDMIPIPNTTVPSGGYFPPGGGALGPESGEPNAHPPINVSGVVPIDGDPGRNTCAYLFAPDLDKLRIT